MHVAMTCHGQCHDAPKQCRGGALAMPWFRTALPGQCHANAVAAAAPYSARALPWQHYGKLRVFPPNSCFFWKVENQHFGQNLAFIAVFK